MTRPSVYCWHHLYDHYYNTYSYTTLALCEEDAIQNIRAEIEKIQDKAMRSYLLLELELKKPEVININQLDKVICSEVSR